jgi:hypothetical protein
MRKYEAGGLPSSVFQEADARSKIVQKARIPWRSIQYVKPEPTFQQTYKHMMWKTRGPLLLRFGFVPIRRLNAQQVMDEEIVLSMPLHNSSVTGTHSPFHTPTFEAGSPQSFSNNNNALPDNQSHGTLTHNRVCCESRCSSHFMKLA